MNALDANMERYTVQAVDPPADDDDEVTIVVEEDEESSVT